MLAGGKRVKVWSVCVSKATLNARILLLCKGKSGARVHTWRRFWRTGTACFSLRLYRSMGHHDHMFKVLIIGDATVGKTSLVQRYANDSFNKHYKSTVGGEWFFPTCTLRDRSAMNDGF